MTKIGLLLSEEPTGQKNGERQRPGAPKPQKRAFVFEDLAPLLLLCRRLRAGKTAFASEAWRDDGGAWWLLLTGEGELPFAREYGREAKAEAARLFLCEHGQTVCEKRAVETLGKL